MKTKHPMQPLELDDEGVIRFKKNAIVRMLLDTHPLQNLNTIHMFNFSKEDHAQLNQLIGYSLDGFADLCLVSDKELDEMDKIAQETLNLKPLKREWVDVGA